MQHIHINGSETCRLSPQLKILIKTSISYHNISLQKISYLDVIFASSVVVKLTGLGKANSSVGQGSQIPNISIAYIQGYLESDVKIQIRLCNTYSGS